MEGPRQWGDPLGPRGLDLVIRVLRPVFPETSLAGLPAGRDGRRAALLPTLEQPRADRQVEARQAGARQGAGARRGDPLAVGRVLGHTLTHKEGTTTGCLTTRTVQATSTRGRSAMRSSTV